MHRDLFGIESELLYGRDSAKQLFSKNTNSTKKSKTVPSDQNNLENNYLYVYLHW